MARRNPEKQSIHDDAVRRIANRLYRRGWDVEADNIDDYNPPESIAGRVPDVVARKGSAKKVIEVETENSLHKDKDQHSTFRRHAGQKGRTKFELYLVYDDGYIEQEE